LHSIKTINLHHSFPLPELNICFLQARGQLEEAAQDLRALLTLARENKAAVLEMPRRGQRKRLAAHVGLQQLDMESGEEREEYEALMVEMADQVGL
jgi:hypothetical protein